LCERERCSLHAWLSLLISGPSVARRRADGSGPRTARGGARDRAAFAAGQGRPVGKTPAARSEPFAQRRARHRGCVLFGYFLLHKQEKVTPSQGCEGSSQGRESGFAEIYKSKKQTHERAHDREPSSPNPLLEGEGLSQTRKPKKQELKKTKKRRLPGSRSWWSPRVSHFDAVTHLPVGGRLKYAAAHSSAGCVGILSR